MAHIDRLTVHKRADMAAFSRRLIEQMARAGLTNSDLARAIWGSTTEGSKTVARNRDRISLYVNGRQMPERDTVEKLAFALSCAPEDLVPDILTTPRGGRASPVSLTVIGGRPDLALLTISQILPTRLAARIAALIAAEPVVEMGGAEPMSPTGDQAAADKAALQAANRARAAEQGRRKAAAADKGKGAKVAAKAAPGAGRTGHR